MARGRKKVEIPILEAYTKELDRLTILEKEMVENLESCRAEIKKYKDLIAQEEMKELKSLMDEKGITIEELKTIITSKEETVIE